MQVEVHEKKKLVCIWLTHADSENSALNEKVRLLCSHFNMNKYTVAVFHSGKQSLRELTSDLLKYNRKLFAEREVKAEKGKTAVQSL